MPQRLMEALIVDGGTCLLKTAAACSCSIALYSSLPPSPVLPLCSACFFFENPPSKNLPRSASSPRPRKQASGLELSCPEGWGLFQLPGWRLPAGGGGQMARGAPRCPPHSWDCSLLKAHNGQLTSCDTTRKSTHAHTCRAVGP